MKTLHEACIEKFGTKAKVAHEVALLNRRLAYRASHVPARKFPCPGVAWNQHDYIAEFEKLNSLKRSVK